MSENRVVIYSNGIADFQRTYTVTSEQPRQISIPVRQDHLGDVLASFNVYGDVAIDSPPTFNPSNELDGNLAIQVDHVIEGLATSLSGAEVRVQRGGNSVEGTLVGLHEEEEAGAGEPIKVKSLILLTKDGMNRIALREIQNLSFLDDDVQLEIDKSLHRNFQRIKPNSTFVELTLSTTVAEAKAVLQYAIPAAAWKISYRLQVSEGQPGRILGFAVVDNNTDEDWSDFIVGVVTGEPITFSTDLAESKSPARNHLNLVSESALGAVEVEAAVMAATGGMELSADYCDDDMEKGMPRMRAMSMAKRSMPRMEQMASIDSATAEEVGDFCIFESHSTVTIPAKRSAVIPVFDISISEAKTVLHFKKQNHPERPYRSIEFKNQTEFSLGRGVCTVFEDNAYGGNCVVPSMKTGEVRLLPHALETGVVVRVDKKRQRNKVVALELANGFCYTSTTQRQRTNYHIKSSRDSTFELFLDHDYLLTEPKLTATISQNGAEDIVLESTPLEDGVRYSISLIAKAEFVICIEEERLDKSEVQFAKLDGKGSFEIQWLERHLVKTNGPLAGDAGVQKCLQLFRERESASKQIRDLCEQTERLAAKQERLRKNIKSGGQDELTSRWRQELDESERGIQAIDDDKIPAMRKQEDEVQQQLRDAMLSLSAQWSDSSV